METKHMNASKMKDIKNFRTSWKTQLWYLFFGKAPITWSGK